MSTKETKQIKHISFKEYMKIGEGATLCSYSDREAYTVIAMTDQTVTLQRDKATLLNGMDSNEPDKLIWSPGGFCGHVTGVQRYSYEADPNGEIVTARLRPQRRVTKIQVGDKWHDVSLPIIKTPDNSTVIAGRHEHYDYNF